jgi:3-ketoacyl-CoA synthase
MEIPDRSRAKYTLEHVVRTHMGSDDHAYECVFECSDDKGNRGVRLDRALMSVAAKGLTKNLSVLGAKILPYSEQASSSHYTLALDHSSTHTKTHTCTHTRNTQLKYAANALHRSYVKWSLGLSTGKKKANPNAHAQLKSQLSKLPPTYIPNFAQAVQHFCIHAGGRAVIDAIQVQTPHSTHNAHTHTTAHMRTHTHAHTHTHTTHHHQTGSAGSLGRASHALSQHAL